MKEILYTKCDLCDCHGPDVIENQRFSDGEWGITYCIYLNSCKECVLKYYFNSLFRKKVNRKFEKNMQKIENL